jgi:hypothetical protein
MTTHHIIYTKNVTVPNLCHINAKSHTPCNGQPTNRRADIPWARMSTWGCQPLPGWRYSQSFGSISGIGSPGSRTMMTFPSDSRTMCRIAGPPMSAECKNKIMQPSGMGSYPVSSVTLASTVIVVEGLTTAPSDSDPGLPTVVDGASDVVITVSPPTGPVAGPGAPHPARTTVATIVKHVRRLTTTPPFRMRTRLTYGRALVVPVLLRPPCRLRLAPSWTSSELGLCTPFSHRLSNG